MVAYAVDLLLYKPIESTTDFGRIQEDMHVIAIRCLVIFLLQVQVHAGVTEKRKISSGGCAKVCLLGLLRKLAHGL